jgi:phage terminase large subunit-like protein
VQGRHEFIAEGIVVHNSWKSGREAWDNASLGNRLGRPHSILTGTPRPLPWLKEIEAMPGTVVRTGSTYENIGNLAPQFIALILGRYEGTRLGAQELHARYLEDVEGALWRLMVIEATRFAHWSRDNPWGAVVEQATLDARLALGLGAWSPEKGERRPWTTWVGVDPPGETAECGIVAGTAPLRGKAGRDHAVVLDDMSVAGAPEVWGARVVECFRKWNADGIVVEANQGGDMCRATIHAVDSSVPVEKIRAKESKADRAEPISALYSRGWVHHYGHLAALENQMTTWVPEESKSPDRLDAMVHLVTKLLSPTNLKQASVGNPLTVQRR